MYSLLLHFRSVFGHASVPPAWVGHLPLAIWASRQRQLHLETRQDGYREATDVEKERLEKLDAIGFAWEYAGNPEEDNDQSLPPALPTSLWTGPWFELSPSGGDNVAANKKDASSGGGVKWNMF